MNKRGAAERECFFQGGWMQYPTVKKKAERESIRLFLISFVTFSLSRKKK
jgi:hypothetical protein